MRTIHDCIVKEFAFYEGCVSDAFDIIKCLKIARIPLFLFYIDNFFKRNQFPTFYLRITNLLIGVILVFHFFACSEFLIERILHGHDLLSDTYKNYWVDKFEIWNTTSTFEIYWHTFYRTFYLLSNFGYNLTPQSTKTNEIMSTTYVILGYIMSIYLISHAFMLMNIIYSPSLKVCIVT